MSTCKRMWTDREVRSMAVKTVEEKENLKVFEHIVDNDGHKRFIEGDISLATIEGVTSPYKKWSLCGTHLMVVLCLDLADATALTNGATLGSVEGLPEWVMSKISPVFSSIVDVKDTTAYGSDYTGQTFGIYLSISDGKLTFIKRSALTLTADRSVRIQFDLLIDDE